jgi:hypothetical protein
MDRITPENIIRLSSNEIFVYGSNLAGRHGKGAAATAYKRFGATSGRCHGLDNHTYGIPTKDAELHVLPLSTIARYVSNFITDATVMRDKKFLVTAIGTGLAGYSANDIAPLFASAVNIDNIYLPSEFWASLNTMKSNV